MVFLYMKHSAALVEAYVERSRCAGGADYIRQGPSAGMNDVSLHCSDLLSSTYLC